MTELKAQCPKCKRLVINYKHFLNHFKDALLRVPPGEYSMRCEPYNPTDLAKDFCFHQFRVRVKDKTEVIII